MNKIHFISGLPRSGSTLLSAILSQNPRFQASMSGPVAGLVTNMLEGMSGRNEFSVFIDNKQRQRVIRSVFDAFYADSPDKIVFDTSRAWCARMGVISELFPESKVIACVREMPWIIDSIERLTQKNVFQPSSIFNYLAGGTVYSRVDGIAGSDGMVGYAFNALREAFYGSHAKNRLMLLQYETLVANPKRALEAIYEFIGEQPYAHDFNSIEFDVTEFDKKAGTPGLHDVRAKVAYQERPTVLPPQVFQRFVNDAFWQNPESNPSNILIV